MKFTIETVSKLTGIPASSLRNWEKRYGFPQPVRTTGGHRYYCSQDVEFLKSAAQWVEQGCCLSEVAKIYLTRIEDRLTGERIAVEVISPALVDDVCYRRELIYNSLLKYDLPATQQHYAILNAKLSPEQLFDQVFEPLLCKIGSEWALGQISIAQEHFGSSFLRLKLAAFLAIDFPPTQPHKILAATVEDERHEGGLMLVSAHLKFRGYPVYYMGVDLPVQDLNELSKELKPKAIALSYLQVGKLEQDLPLLMKTGYPLILGGQALASSPQLDRIKEQLLNLGGAASHIHFCQRKVGSEAARYVEFVCLGNLQE